MTEISTKEVYVLKRKIYPAFGRPADCGLELIGETDLKPQPLTMQMLLDSNLELCTAGCGKCSITVA